MGSITSTITFLYTDIEGSTWLWERQPEAMRVALDRHNEILNQAIAENGGHIFRTAGDAFSASFAVAPSALLAAVQAQRLLYAEAWQLEKPLRVRIVLHTGEVEALDGDYVGSSLNHIGRLLAACHGGQTLLTLVTKELARDSLPDGVSLLDLGEHRFRDLTNPEHIFQLSIKGLPDQFPPLRSLDSYPNNLPNFLTSFIGRERDLQEIKELLAASRLVTLTGPGGTGKTRLAIQTAAQALDEFPDGAWVVELAPISDPEMIPQSIASALNIREQPTRPLRAVLIDALRPKKLLLVLDNCEHLINASAAMVMDLLRACPNLKMLTTSREMLGVAGERIFLVPSLALPEAQQPSFEDYARSEAVQLFAARATAIQPKFKLTAENCAMIVQICRRLDGIPLAIELAAARTTLFTPAQIASRLDDRFRLLTGGSRSALPRQQTLEALFDWSHELLSDGEKEFFRRLSVFAGGWTIEAAEAVCGEEFSAGKSSLEVVDLLAQLVNKSLVVVDESGDEARYRMLETIRQYAQKKLVEAGEAIEIRKRHMQYFAKIAQDAWISIRNNGAEWLGLNQNDNNAEIDNYRAAQTWAIEYDLSTALLFAGSLFYFWIRGTYADEMRRYIAEVLRRAESAPEFQGELDRPRVKLLASAWTGYSELLIIIGYSDDGLEASTRAIELARKAEDLPILSLALSIQGIAASLTGKADLAHAAGEESVAIGRMGGEKWILAMSLITTWSYAQLSQKDIAGTERYIDEGLKLFRSLKDPYWYAFAEVFAGMYMIRRGNLTMARDYFTDAASVLQNYSDPYSQNVARSGLADVARLEGDYDRSVAFYVKTLKAWRRLGNLGAVARCLECIGFISIMRARSCLTEECISNLQAAAKLFNAAETIRKETRAAMTPTEQVEFDGFKAELNDAVAHTKSSYATTASPIVSTEERITLDEVLAVIQ